jgi:hypothetical protein
MPCTSGRKKTLLVELMPNAAAQPPLEAGATEERTL